MGLPVYSRLWWDGHRGQAVCGCVDVDLREVPHILELDPCEIDYCEAHPGELVCPPEIRIHVYDKRREMEPPEIAACRLWLRGLLAAVIQYNRRRR